MQQSDVVMNIENYLFQKILLDFNAKILNVKGRYFSENCWLKKCLWILGNFKHPKLSSYLFNLPIEMERGLVTIENVQSKLVEQIDKLKQQKNKKQLSTVKVLSNKE